MKMGKIARQKTTGNCYGRTAGEGEEDGAGAD